MMRNNSNRSKTIASKQDAFNTFVQFLFMFQVTIKLYHWRTDSYSRHLITDKFNTSLLEVIDRFVETFIGNYNMKPQFDMVPVLVDNISDSKIIDLFLVARTTLQNVEEFTQNSELLAIRDDLLAYVEQTIYLFRFQ